MKAQVQKDKNRAKRTKSRQTKVGKQSRLPTAVDLFCGCGGLTQGLRSAGFNVVGAVEIEPGAVDTYAFNHPDVHCWEMDIRKLTAAKVRATLNLSPGELDLLAGCPPCQTFSTMTTRNGSLEIREDNDDLLKEFLRFVKGLRPKAVMLENVAGLGNTPIFETFRKKMAALGYLGQFTVLDAADFGVPQRRKRLIYLAGYGFEIPFSTGDGEITSVREAIGNLPKPGESGDDAHDVLERRSERVLNIFRNIPENGGSRKDLPEHLVLKCHLSTDGYKDVYGRMKWDDVAPTITGGCFNPSKGRFLHPTEHRAITLREAALLQGFPRDYLFPYATNKSATALLIGNALPPPFIEAHADMIRKKLLEKRTN